MLPFLLAGLGGYLIGQSQKKDVSQMAKGGVTFGKFGKGRLNKNAWVAANYIGDSKIELGDLQSYLERNTNENFDKNKIYTITRTLYKSGDYEIEDNKDWKLSKIYRKRKMTKGGTTGDVEVSVSLTKDESLLLYVVLDTKLKDEGRKIPKMKEAIQAKIIDAGESEQIELRLSVEQIMLIYLYMEEVQKKEPKLKPKMFKDITKKLFQAVERSNKALPKHFAQGGVLEHGLREGDRILVVNDSFAGIVDKDGNRIIVNIEEGTRRESTI